MRAKVGACSTYSDAAQNQWSKNWRLEYSSRSNQRSLWYPVAHSSLHWRVNSLYWLKVWTVTASKPAMWPKHVWRSPWSPDQNKHVVQLHYPSAGSWLSHWQALEGEITDISRVNLQVWPWAQVGANQAQLSACNELSRWFFCSLLQRFIISL